MPVGSSITIPVEVPRGALETVAERQGYAPLPDVKSIVCAQLTIGKGEIIRYGEDVVILAIGAAVAPVLEAAKELATIGIEATVVNARFAKPLDSELIIDQASHTKRLVTVEENALYGGFGSSVAKLLQESGIHDIQVRSIGIPDEFVEQGSQAILRAKYSLDAKGIAQQVSELFYTSDSSSSLTTKTKALSEQF